MIFSLEVVKELIMVNEQSSNIPTDFRPTTKKNNPVIHHFNPSIEKIRTMTKYDGFDT